MHFPKKYSHIPSLHLKDSIYVCKNSQFSWPRDDLHSKSDTWKDCKFIIIKID